MSESDRRFKFETVLGVRKFVTNNLPPEISYEDRVQISEGVAQVIKYIVEVYRNSYFILDTVLQSFAEVRDYNVKTVAAAEYLLRNSQLLVESGNSAVPDQINPHAYDNLAKAFTKNKSTSYS